MVSWHGWGIMCTSGNKPNITSANSLLSIIKLASPEEHEGFKGFRSVGSNVEVRPAASYSADGLKVKAEIGAQPCHPCWLLGNTLGLPSSSLFEQP